MCRKYVKPIVKVISFNHTNLLVGSVVYPESKICNNNCKIWHICNDRDTYRGSYCHDKH